MPNPNFLSQRKTAKEKKEQAYGVFGYCISGKRGIF